jgi:NAD(P)-dependent dehydrogenase (short-subunit alcohol dehydrogenase family)
LKMKCGNGSLLRNAIYLGIGLASTAAAMVSSRSQRRSQWASGKVVVITGGSRGLGLALAEEFGRGGARLVLAARDEAELSRARRQLLERGLVRGDEDVLLVAADLREAAEAERLIREATTRFGRVDLLINNAGVITVGPVENQTLEQFREVMESNFYTGLHCTMAVLPQMLRRKEGSIANVASIGGRVAVPHLLPYTASKFAVVGFSEGLGMELRAKGIRVTTICPGLMRTGSHRNAIFTGDAEREYRWFSMAANLPGASASASAAARRIANGIAAGAAEITITPQAWLAARFGNLSPELKRLVMAGAIMALPDPVDGYPEGRRGEDVRGRELFPASTIGTYAAHRYNEAEAVSET